MATSNTEVSRLLVLGPDQDSRRAVVSKLRELSGDAALDSDASVLNLRTKYYRAPVEVHAHQVRDNAPEPALQHTLHDYEALLCVVDAGQRESVLHVQCLAKRVVDTLPYDVCLLAAATASAPRESVRKLEGWCQDNGFEFVDLDAEQRAVDDDSVIDEKHGVERVLEALHCNMWRSMEMNPPIVEEVKPTKVEVEDAAPEVEAEKEEDVGDEQKSDNQVKDKDNNATVAAAAAAAEEEEEMDTATDNSRLQALLQALEIAGGPDAGSGDAGDGDDDDLDMAEFSALISEVRDVRDQGQSLTDEQRRERAAEVALKLWNFLGEDGDASDSD